MKNFIKNTIATLILLTILTFNAFACGDMQCPNKCGDMQCPGVITPILQDKAKENSDQKAYSLSDFIVKMFEDISFLF